MEKNEQYYQQKIAEEIRRISKLEGNEKTAGEFWEILEKIKPKSCIVKSGASAGKYIDFVLAFEKGGTANPFDLFIKDIPEAAFSYGILFGLNPDIIHFNPRTHISDETHDFLMFKLQKDAQREKNMQEM